MPKVFISYLRENRKVVSKLVRDLRSYGIEVWLDEDAIKPGAEWSQSIRDGIDQGNFFIPCFSKEYHGRDETYMNDELTLAIEKLRQRSLNHTWFIPVLLSKCDIPDRDIGDGKSLRSVHAVKLYENWHDNVRKIVSTLLPETIWEPYEFELPYAGTMVLLPLRPFEGKTLCVGKFPVTNSQYKEFLKGRKYDLMVDNEPTGEHLCDADSAQWSGPFYPWREEGFNDSDKPVVCISYSEASEYCDWLRWLGRGEKFLFYLPTAKLWDFAAFGNEFPTWNPKEWLTLSQEIYHKERVPSSLDFTGKRLNKLGVSDMIGNVWEWCADSQRFRASRLFGPPKILSGPKVELRGGGFFDDISRISPVLSSSEIKDGAKTRHTDLGFRLAAEIRVDYLSLDVRKMLSAAQISAEQFLVTKNG
jgi:formylglycine-generating enzyme required for sulfatase activity